ncbi:MAG TPA: hypothetical protein VIT21_10965 [Chthoniobacterales bacterium]
MRNAVSNWTRNDPASAASWLGHLPDGKTRDQMISSFSNNVTDIDPEAAASWAASIGGESHRRNTLSNVISQWARTDRPSAEAWVNRQGFSFRAATATAHTNTQHEVAQTFLSAQRAELERGIYSVIER